jgi:hypothetical protein
MPWTSPPPKAIRFNIRSIPKKPRAPSVKRRLKARQRA